MLTDLDGNVIGWIDMDHSRSDSPNLLCAIGITGMKSQIEKMSNEIRMGYLGIHATDIPESVRTEQGLPEGAYIQRTEMDSPAMEAGIQSGDVIIGLGDTEINNYQELIGCILESKPEQAISVKLLRQGPEEYTEMELDVTPAIR